MRSVPFLALVACSSGHRDGPADDPTSGPSDTGTGSTTTIESDASEIALQAQLIEVTASEDPWISARLAAAPFAPPGATLQLYVARATDASELEGGLLPGLRPVILSYHGYPFELAPGAAPGAYDWWEVQPGTAFPYVEGTDVRFEAGAVEAWSPIALAFQPSHGLIDVPEYHPAGSPMVLDYANQAFTSDVAMVLDADGAVTWSNNPDSIATLYAINQVEAESLTIPGEAFSAVGDYVVGVAPCTRTAAGDLTDLDPALSAVRVGRMSLFRVRVE